MEVCWENHRSKWGIFQQTMFESQGYDLGKYRKHHQQYERWLCLKVGTPTKNRGQQKKKNGMGVSRPEMAI